MYVEAISRRVVGSVLRRVRVRGPFVLRTFEPPVEAVEGRRVARVERVGKRIVLALEGELFVVVHLMIAGRFRWVEGVKGAGAAGKIALVLFEFDGGTLTLTEAGTKKRASIHVVAGRDALEAMNPGGLDVFTCTPAQFEARLKERNNTLKRALTDPRRFDGIGNAYSDEILHAAGMSPLRTTALVTSEQAGVLLDAARSTLTRWTERLREEFGLAEGGVATAGVGRFPGPGEITAFRPDFAVHGKYGKPCPVCGTSVQRIVYAENECNYCPRCQTEGKMLADRAMSRLLKDDWPRTVEEWEGGERAQSGRAAKHKSGET